MLYFVLCDGSFAEALLLLAADSAGTVVVVVDSVADAAGFAG